MNRKLITIAPTLTLSLFIVAVLFTPPMETSVASWAKPAPLCACCADHGEWYQVSERISAEMRQEINRVKFSEATNSSADADGAPFADGKFELTQSKDLRLWQLRFTGAEGKSDTLSLPIPLRLVSFGADVRDGQMGGGGGPLLYKEWRFQGGVTSTGVFKSWGNARFHLVFQGRGNHCTQAEDFKSWNLSVKHGSASLSLYGLVAQ